MFCRVEKDIYKYNYIYIYTPDRVKVLNFVFAKFLWLML